MPDAQMTSVSSTALADGLLVRVDSDINLKNSPELRAYLMELIKSSPRRLVIDLSAVGFMDSSGVATLVEALRMQKQRGGKLVLCSMQQRVRSVFQISRLDSLFTIVADPAAAQAS